MCLTIPSNNYTDADLMFKKVENKKLELQNLKKSGAWSVTAYKIFAMHYEYNRNASIRGIRLISPYRKTFIHNKPIYDLVASEKRKDREQYIKTNYVYIDIKRPKKLSRVERAFGQVAIGLHSMTNIQDCRAISVSSLTSNFPHIILPISIDYDRLVAVGYFDKKLSYVSLHYSLLHVRIDYKKISQLKNKQILDATTNTIIKKAY